MRIALSRGYFVEIDDDQEPLIAGRHWYTSGTPPYVYAASRVTRGVVLLMHRVLTDCPPGFVVDHIDGNTRNNRRANLRVCRQRENLRNTKLRRDNTSGTKGVFFSNADKKWIVTIDRKRFGAFDAKEEAVAFRHHLEKVLHGEFARINGEAV